MRKIFRLARAELNKIFIRPSMFVLATTLFIALVLSFFIFTPKTTQTKFEYNLNTTSAIYLRFEEEYIELETTLINAKKKIDEYLSSNNDALSSLNELSENVKTKFNLLRIAIQELPKNSLYPSLTELNAIKGKFNDFKSFVKDLKDFLFYQVNDKSVNFFITNKDFDELYNKIKNIYETIPSDSQLDQYTTLAIIDRFNLINDSYSLDKITYKLSSSNLEKIIVDETQLNELLNKYYNSNIIESFDNSISYTHTGKLKDLYDNVVNFYNNNPSSSDQEVMTEMNNEISKFYDYIQICSKLIANNFELLRIGNKSDDEIINYNGFSGISIYNLKREITISEYFY